MRKAAVGATESRGRHGRSRRSSGGGRCTRMVWCNTGKRTGKTKGSPSLAGWFLGQLDETQTQHSGTVHELHRFRAELPEAPDEPLLVDGPDLIEEDDRIDLEAALRGRHGNLRGVQPALELRRDGSDDGDGAETVGDIVLQNYRWARLLDLRAQRRIEVDEVYLASPRDRYLLLCCHASSSRANHSPASRRSRSARRMAPSFTRLR